ncbi:MAG: hypothetical protein WC501_02515 [Candidatus Micrarchaeia archaeon]|jgi:phosphopantetheine adenylyltransferase
MKEYQPRSEFLKEKLKKANKKNAEYLMDLLTLEKLIVNEEKITGFAHSMRLHSLKSEYEKEYLQMLKELDPKGYAVYLEDKKKYKTEKKQIVKQEKDERVQAIEEFINEYVSTNKKNK